MPGFVYFTSEAKHNVTLSQVREWGLEYAFDAAPTSCPVTGKGPNGTQGVAFANKRYLQSAQTGVFPGRQTWRQIPGKPVWVGYLTAERPTPETLARPNLLDGHALELADGNRWTVPLARACAETDDGQKIRWWVNLPQRLDLDERGEWTADSVLPRYERLWRTACRWYDWSFGGTTDEAEIEHWKIYQNHIAAAVEVLQENYAIGPVEAAMLGILTAELVKDILDALIDGKKLKAFYDKKKLSTLATLHSLAGPEDSTAATDQPSPTSSASPSVSPTPTQ